jgi:hypothetical protein
MITFPIHGIFRKRYTHIPDDGFLIFPHELHGRQFHGLNLEP